MSKIFNNIGKRITPRQRLYIRWTILVVCLLIMILVLNELNFRYVNGKELGEHFYTHWMATRLFLARGEDVYSSEVHQWIAEYANNILLWKDYQGADAFYLQPVFGFLFYTPFIFINDFYSAFAAWLTFLQFSLIGLSFFSLKILNKNLKKNLLVTVLTFIVLLFNYSTFQSLVNGNIIILVALLFFMGIYFIQKEGYELAGVLFAFATICVPIFILPFVFITLWGIRRKYLNLIGWFYGTLFLLGISSALLFPNWLFSFAGEWIAYYQMNGAQFLNVIMSSYYPGTSGRLAYFIMILAVIGLIIEWSLNRRYRFELFYWTISITIVISLLLLPSLKMEDIIIILPIFALIATLWIDRWQNRGILVVFAIFLVILLYPWFLSLNQKMSMEQMRFWQTLPIPFLFIANLYWIRWWLFKNTDLWFDDMFGFENQGK